MSAPIVVVNPEKVVETLRTVANQLPYGHQRNSLKALADQIEESIPAMEEPLHIGDMAIAAEASDPMEGERFWTRFSHTRTLCWIDGSAHIRSWDELHRPRPFVREELS